MAWRDDSPAQRARGAIFWILLAVGAAVWAVLIFRGEPALGAAIGVGAFLCAVMLHFLFVAREERGRERDEDADDSE
jgi:hypothetical protein